MMKLQMSSVLLVSICTLSSWSVSSGTIVVTQTSEVSVREWETANITCCWTEKLERVAVNWLKNQTSIKSQDTSSKTRCQESLQKDQCNCTTLTVTNITRQDSGTYICKVSVEIPFYAVVEGNGTVLKVIARDRTGDSTDVATGSGVVLPVPAEDSSTDDNTLETTSGAAPQGDTLIHILRCLPIVALILTFFYLYNSGSKVQPQTPAAPGNNQTSIQKTEQRKEDEDIAERERERREEDEDENGNSDD